MNTIKRILIIFWQSYFIILIAIAPLLLVKDNTSIFNWIRFILCMIVGVIGLRLELFKEFKEGDYLWVSG